MSSSHGFPEDGSQNLYRKSIYNIDFSEGGRGRSSVLVMLSLVTFSCKSCKICN